MRTVVNVLVAAVGATIAIACSGPDETRGPDLATTSSATSTCSTTSAGQGWDDAAIADQNGHFWLFVDLVPSAANIDAVFGIAPSAPQRFSDLAAIVRMSPAGTFDVRNGSTYAADATVAYVPGVTYHVWLDVDVASHSYSVSVQPDGGASVQIAKSYAFRTEQAGATHLGWMGREVDSATGSFQSCNLEVSTTETCTLSGAPGSWTNVAKPAQNERFSVGFDATPSVADIDAVVGVSSGAATTFKQLAAIVRFNDAGYVDVRNGSAYGADSAYPYAPNTTYHVTMTIDVYTHRYDVAVSTGGGAATTIASRYAFRTEQASVATLDDVAFEVDGGAGTLDVCGLVATTLPPAFLSTTTVAGDMRHVALTPDGHVLASRYGDTQILDGAGSITRSVPYGGSIGVDAGGNIVVASDYSGTVDLGGTTVTSSGGNDVYVAKYDSSWRLLWARSFGDASISDALSQLSVSPAGASAITGYGIGTVVLDPSGSTVWADGVEGSTIALDGSGDAYRAGPSSAIVVTKLAPDGSPLWATSFAGTGYQDVQQLAVTPSGGVAFAGEFNGTISFGGSSLHYAGSSGEGPAYEGYLVSLDANGHHVASAMQEVIHIRRVAVGSDGKILITGNNGSQLDHLELEAFAADATGLWTVIDPTALGAYGFGFGRDVVVAPDGTSWWSADAKTRSSPAATPWVVHVEP